VQQPRLADLCLQLIMVHLPGAGLCKNKKRHDGVLCRVPQPRLLLSMEAWEGGSMAAVLALLSRAPSRKKLSEEQFFTTSLEFRWGTRVQAQFLQPGQAEGTYRHNLVLAACSGVRLRHARKQQHGPSPRPGTNHRKQRRLGPHHLELQQRTGERSCHLELSEHTPAQDGGPTIQREQWVCCFWGNAQQHSHADSADILSLPAATSRASSAATATGCSPAPTTPT